MKEFLEHQAADRRLCILRLLKDSGGTANDSILHSGLEMLGHRHQTRDTIRADIRHLLDQGLVTDEWFANVQVCSLTRRGADVADGRIEAQGVKKPSLWS